MTRCLAFWVLNAAAMEGIKVTAEGDNLKLSAPPGVLTPEIVAFIASHKSALLALLTRKPVPSHVPGIVWDPRGGVRLADEHLVHMTKIDSAGPEGSRVVMLEQECRPQAAQEEAEEIAFFTRFANDLAAEFGEPVGGQTR